MTCWSCGAPAAATDRCPACGALQPAPAGEDLFAALGVQRGFDQDPAELERRFRERVRAFHPDRFARAPARERRIALDRSARVNEAHRTLAAPRRRAAYLLTLLGEALPARPATVQDAALLEEQLAVRERIEAARAAGDAEELGRLSTELAARLDTLDVQLAQVFAAHASPSEARRLLDEARLLERALELARGEGDR